MASLSLIEPVGLKVRNDKQTNEKQTYRQWDIQLLKMKNYIFKNIIPAQGIWKKRKENILWKEKIEGIYIQCSWDAFSNL